MKRRLLSATALLLLGAASPSPSPTSSPTPLTICNQTDIGLQVAVGYVVSGTMNSEGWYGVGPGQCKKIDNSAGASTMYWWGAQANGVNSHGSTWATFGGRYFCVSDPYGNGPVPNFTFQAENASTSACVNATPASSFGRNLWVSVRVVDMSHPTVNFYGQ